MGTPDIAELYRGQANPEQAAHAERRDVVDEAATALLAATVQYEPLAPVTDPALNPDRMVNVNLNSMVGMYHQRDLDLAA